MKGTAGHALRHRAGSGAMGANVTTRGLDLIALPVGTVLSFGGTTLLALTGLRNPCPQLNGYQGGLMNAVLDRAADGTLVRKAGVMAVVAASGILRPGDPNHVALPPEPHHALDRV